MVSPNRESYSEARLLQFRKGFGVSYGLVLTRGTLRLSVPSASFQLEEALGYILRTQIVL